MTSSRTRLAIVFVLLGLALASGVGCGGGDGRPEGDDFEQKRAKESATPTDLSRALYPSGQAPTPLPMSRFAREDGLFVIPEYDDRRLSEAQKAADPVRNPRWPAFVRCMQAAGLGLGIRDPEQASQADIDALMAEVNRAGPSYVWSARGPLYQPSPGGDAFLGCEHHLYFEALATATATP